MKRFNFPFSKVLFTATILVCLLTSHPANSQVSFDDDVDDETPAAPIDGLLGLGIAIGAWYGIKKLKEKQ